MEKKVLTASSLAVTLLFMTSCVVAPPTAPPPATLGAVTQFPTTQAATLTPTPTPRPVSSPDLVASITAAASTLTPGAPATPTLMAVQGTVTASATPVGSATWGQGTPVSTLAAIETSTPFTGMTETPAAMPNPTPG